MVEEPGIDMHRQARGLLGWKSEAEAAGRSEWANLIGGGHRERDRHRQRIIVLPRFEAELTQRVLNDSSALGAGGRDS